MENNDKYSTSLIPFSYPSPPPPFPPPPPPVPPVVSPPRPVVISPCAACKTLRRRCVEKCVLAPYFPPTEPHKFKIAHRVFGASNIIKSLQELPESQRSDAVSSMVYEASARLRDPVYGSAGAICQLQKQVADLQARLTMAQAEIAAMQMQCRQANLVALICTEMAQSNKEPISQNHQLYSTDAGSCLVDGSKILLQPESLFGPEE